MFVHTSTAINEYEGQTQDMLEPINHPWEGPTRSPRQVDVASTVSNQPTRTTVILNGVFVEGQDKAAKPCCPGHPLPSPQPLTCLTLVERVIGDWARTLRIAMLLVIVLLGLDVLIIVGFGIGGAAIITGLATTWQLMLRHLRHIATA